MKAFWRQGLLIGIATVAVGCSYMSREGRLLAAGYPPEYVTGFVAGLEEGYEWACVRPGASWEPYCRGKNLELKVEQKPRNSESYRQGRADGHSLALDHALAEDEQRRRDLISPLFKYTYMPNTPIPELNK